MGSSSSRDTWCPRARYFHPERVQVDSVFEEAFGSLRLPSMPRLFTPKGAEKHKERLFGPMTRALM